MVTTAGRKARRAEAAAKLSADPAHKDGPHKDAAGAGHEKRRGSTSQQPVGSASPHNKGSKRKKGKRGKRASRGGEGESTRAREDGDAGDDILAMPKGKPAPPSLSPTTAVLTPVSIHLVCLHSAL